jgi:hypothetical protein
LAPLRAFCPREKDLYDLSRTKEEGRVRRVEQFAKRWDVD